MLPAKAVFMTAIGEAVASQQLRSLLVDYGERPHIRVDGVDYVLGLVDSRPMLVRTRDKMFVAPEMVANSVAGFDWKSRT